MTETATATETETESPWPRLSDDDLAAYLRRIDHPGGPATLDTLRGVTAAHVRAIPFENVDVVLGRHRGIALDVVTDKLVRHRRGGYCYEHNPLLSGALESLGFEVRRVVSRVQPHKGGPHIHMSMLVTVEDEQYVVDVGFGANMPLPMPLRDGAEVDQFGWPHRLEHDGRRWLLSLRGATGWEPQLRFDDDPAEPVDYEVGHHFCSLHPKSPFVDQLTVMRLEPGRSRRFVGHELITELPDGTVDRVAVTDPLATLADLDVDLDDDDARALTTWWAARA